MLAVLLAIIVVAAECQKAPITGDEAIEKLTKNVEKLQGQLGQISRQLMLQQFFAEEKLRNEGFSGIKQVRTSKCKHLSKYWFIKRRPWG